MTQPENFTQSPESDAAGGKLAMSRRQALGVLGALGAASFGGSANAVPVMRGKGVRGQMSGAKATVEALCCAGTRCVFGVPGAQNNELWDAMKSRGLEYLLVTNEFSASIMADGASRATGSPGVFAVVPGPGVTNALTGIGEALLDSVPLVGIVTDVARGPAAPAFQVHSLPVVDLLRPVTKKVIEVKHQDEIPSAVQQAFQLSCCGEPGPVAVVIPFDLYAEAGDYNGATLTEPLAEFDEFAFREAVRMLANPNCRVGIYAGGGCSNAGPALAAVAEMLQAPVATSVSGKGCIPDSHPLAVGWGYGPQGTRAAELTFKNVDLVLAIGVKYSEVSTGYYSIPEHEQVIHVDANRENLGRNVGVQVRVCADSRVFLDRLLAESDALRRPHCPTLLRRVQSLRSLDRVENTTVRITDGVDPMIFFTKLRELMGPEELLFVDVTASTHWASEAFSVEGPRRYFTPADNQAMGWAVAASIGAQRVRPDRQVFSVTGDGCFLMSAAEISTAARAGLPVKFFVLADGAYHYMQMLQKAAYRRTTATELASLDYEGIARGFGLAYNEIPNNDTIEGGILQAMAMEGPVLTRVTASYEGREIRWMKAVRHSYIERMSTRERLRAAARIGLRSLNHRPHND